MRMSRSYRNMKPPEHTNNSAELEEELSSFPEKERLEFIRAWDLVGEAKAPVENVPALDDAWADLQSRIHTSSDSEIRRPDRAARRSSALRSRRLVAGGVVLVAAAVFLWIWQRPVTAIAPEGELSAVALADGSTVHLNSGTRLRYRPRVLPGAANRLRSVELDGEAFFEITPAEQPFIVETATAVVEVLGTRFNVRARSEDADRTAEVTLESGRVRVVDRHNPVRSILLTRPGERVEVGLSRARDSSLVADTATLDYVLAWRRDAFAAIDRPISSIIAELERRYALNIDVEDDLDLQDSMTLLYGPGTTAERILHDVCLVRGCRYRPTTHGFALFVPSSEPNK